MERAIQLLANSEEAKSKRRERGSKTGSISKKTGTREAARRNENADEKAVREESRKEEIRPKAKLQRLVISSLRVQP